MDEQTLLTPLVDLAAEQVGRRRFWKQILPVTSINYEGRKVDFDPTFHMDLAQAYKSNAFDQVPIVFADAKNGHNMDPRNFGGDVVDLEYRGDGPEGGTWALIEADKDAAKVIERNPKLGVSARIRQAIEKADGRFFKRGIEHVLLTMNPRVTGMSPWQAVDLSDEDDPDTEVVDLTAAEYREGNEMGNTKTRRQQPKIDLSAMDDDEFQALVVDLAAQAAERGVEFDDLDVDDDEDLEEEQEEPTPRRRRSKVKVTKTTEKDLEADEEDDEDEDDDTDLSERVIRRTEVSQFGQMRIDLAKRDWNTKRDQYLAAGVPPVLLDLATPVLSQPDEMVIDLADSDGKEQKVDFRQVLTKMLDNVQGIVDLSGPIGNAIDLTADEEQTREADLLLEAWDKNYSA